MRRKFYLNRDALVKEVRRRHEAGRTVLFTNGCFDPLRAKHVKFFELAKKAVPGSVLLVAVNEDCSVRRLKGPGRPIFPCTERMDILAGLRCVDLVTCFREDDPATLVAVVHPDVIVKGGDYKVSQVAGHSFVKRVIIIPTEDAWEVKVRPPSINELLARSVAAMVRGAEANRDLNALYKEKKS